MRDKGRFQARRGSGHCPAGGANLGNISCMDRKADGPAFGKEKEQVPEGHHGLTDHGGQERTQG